MMINNAVGLAAYDACKNKSYEYVYGMKGTVLTSDKLKQLAKQYPAQVSYNKEKKKIGHYCIDCSGLVSVCSGNSVNMNSTAHANATGKVWSVKDLSHLETGMFVWKQGHIGIVYIDKNGNKYICEARNSSKGLCVSKLSSRIGDFKKYGCIKGVSYGGTNTKSYFKACKSKYQSIVDALASIGVNTSFNYRSRIAVVNGIKNYTGTAKQNTKMLTLLKKGKLVKP